MTTTTAPSVTPSALRPVVRFGAVVVAIFTAFGAGVAVDNIVWSNGGGVDDGSRVVDTLDAPSFEQSILETQATTLIPVYVTAASGQTGPQTFEQTIIDSQETTVIPAVAAVTHSATVRDGDILTDVLNAQPTTVIP